MANIEDQTHSAKQITPAHIQRYFHDVARASGLEAIQQTFARHLFFITMTFKPNSVTLYDDWTTCRKPTFDTLEQRLHVPQRKHHPLTEAHRFCNHISQHVIGNNFRRKPFSQPASIWFVDAMRTKGGGQVHRTSSYLHANGLLFIRESEQLNDFRIATEIAKVEVQMSKRAQAHLLPVCCDGFTCEPFNPDKATFLDGISYWMKGYTNTPAFDYVLTGKARLNEKPPREPSLIRYLPDMRLQRSVPDPVMDRDDCKKKSVFVVKGRH